MPPTEECVLGAENKARIINLEKLYERMINSVDELTNHYSQRPTRGVLVAITALTGLLGTCIGVIAMLIIKLT